MKKKVITGIVVLMATGLLAVAGNYLWSKFSGNEKPELPSLKDELSKIAAKYDIENNGFTIKGDINLFDGENPGAVKEKTSFYFSKKGNQFCSQLSYQQTLCNGKVVLQADTVNKILIVSTISTEALAAAQKSVMPFDKMFSEDTTSFRISGTVSETGKQRKVYFKNDYTPEVRSVSLFYDTLQYNVIKSEIEWWKDAGAVEENTKGNPVWITKINYEYLPFQDLNIDEKISRFVSIKDNKAEPALPYKDYKILVKL